MHIAGRKKILKVRGIVVKDETGQPAKVLGVDMDVTTMVEAEQKLRESERQLAKVLDSLPQIAWTVKMENEINYFNKRWYEYSGLSLEDSTQGGWLRVVHPDFQMHLLDKWRDCFHKGANLNEQYLLKNKEGEFRWHLAKIVGVKNEEGEIYMWIGTSTDIHEQVIADQKIIEQELRAQQQKLNIVLEAEERERRRISEGLHNGVGQLLYGTSLLLEEIKLGEEPIDLAQLAKAKEKVESLIMESIKQVRNISHELTPLLLEDHGLPGAVRNFCRTLSSESLCLESDVYDLEMPLDKYIEIAVYRISQELANNIVKHAKATRGLLEIFCQSGELFLIARDNGNGFKPDSSKGIGLKTIKERVSLLKGATEIESVAGKGTTIRIKIPLKKEKAML